MSNPSVADRAALVLGAAALLVVAAHRGVPGLLPVALLTVPLVLVDVRERRLPNVLTLPLLVLTAVPVLSAGALAAVLGTGVALWMLHGSGGLGLGDVKLGAALAPPLAQLGADRVVLAPALAFVLAGVWVLVLRLRAERMPFGPFQLAAFWLVVAG
ncbi:leader peptidase (prepilin peptidase)/N-methyltransferase [Rathayibacter tanaceti]|uniref:Prepilin type IV endopeptidase peptidase domain-containing protein n=2 Tax=Rathayibacter tanaceti TaxID=1671680 RepID=A0AAE6RKY6_9MICO|nr:prepilin peptidase [Rathayibacter tanaceti]QHC55931.1 hypothetical protein GSU10_10010 [Rathayibacter tanaceti]TCO39232.1 leader peptidase (prepilin peptidase)/N-methyltransferase [Rathayibacter tanaceti]